MTEIDYLKKQLLSCANTPHPLDELKKKWGSPYMQRVVKALREDLMKEIIEYKDNLKTWFGKSYRCSCGASVVNVKNGTGQMTIDLVSYSGEESYNNKIHDLHALNCAKSVWNLNLNNAGKDL